MYPSAQVTELISTEMLAVRSHVKNTPQYWGRFNVRWTPTVLLLDSRGREQHRIEGYLPTDEFLGQLYFGLGLVAAGEKDWERAIRHFEIAASEFANTDAGPAGLYWLGAARYSHSHDASHLRKTAEEFLRRFTNTSWAKRSTVWLPQKPKEAAA